MNVTNVTLSEHGVALIVLEQELRNNSIELTRWLRRRLEAEDHIEIVRKNRAEIEATIQRIKAAL